MNIWDPVWKQETEDNTESPVYKMKPIEIPLSGIYFYAPEMKSGSKIVDCQFVLDIEYSPEYIKTLDVDKRRLWVLDDGDCVVSAEFASDPYTTAISNALRKLMGKAVQRKWKVEKITNGVRLSIDLPREMYYPTVPGSRGLTLRWKFGSVKLLIPEPTRFDLNVVTMYGGFIYKVDGPITLRDGVITAETTGIRSGYMNTQQLTNYKEVKLLQFATLNRVAVHKFTIDSSANWISEIKDVCSVPVETFSINTVQENHPEYPITYHRASSNKSIGSSSRPKEKYSKLNTSIPRVDQTQLKGRSLKSLGIVGKILSIIKRRKREIK